MGTAPGPFVGLNAIRPGVAVSIGLNGVQIAGLNSGAFSPVANVISPAAPATDNELFVEYFIGPTIQAMRFDRCNKS